MFFLWLNSISLLSIGNQPKLYDDDYFDGKAGGSDALSSEYATTSLSDHHFYLIEQLFQWMIIVIDGLIDWIDW